MSRVGHVRFCLHAEPEQIHAEDGEEDEQAAHPLAQQEVSRAGTSHPATSTSQGSEDFSAGSDGDFLSFSGHASSILPVV